MSMNPTNLVNAIGDASRLDDDAVVMVRDVTERAESGPKTQAGTAFSIKSVESETNPVSGQTIVWINVEEV